MYLYRPPSPTATPDLRKMAAWVFFHLAGKVDLTSKVGDVVLLKTKAFNNRLMCLFCCRKTENKRVNGKSGSYLKSSLSFSWFDIRGVARIFP